MTALAHAGALLLLAAGTGCATRTLLDDAQAVADWVGAETPATVDAYAGRAGEVLFWAMLADATGDARAHTGLQRGADALIAALPESVGAEGAGLYDGVAGTGAALLEAMRVTGEPRFAEAARRVTDLVVAAPAGPTNDVIHGLAGTGLFLLQAARKLDHAAAMVRARELGHELLGRAMPAASGRQWPVRAAEPRRLPNFSHGTAGVAFFLARLFEETAESEFLAGAVAGGRALLALADRSDGGLRVRHHEPGGEGLFYLGWCHGPAGTGRLFLQLWKLTGERAWLRAAQDGAESILASGIPARRPEGFWNNVGLCCGSAGVAEFLLRLHELAPDPRYLACVDRLTEDLLARATRDAAGLRWTHAEHRVQPDRLATPSGWMQGAAGVGAWLLQLDAFRRGLRAPARRPDEPRFSPFAIRGAWLSPREGFPLDAEPTDAVLARLRADGVTHVAVGHEVAMPRLDEPRLEWGARDAELRATLRRIHRAGLASFLLPRIESPAFFAPPYPFRGDIRFRTPGAWERFHADLERCCLHYARLCAEEGVAIFGLGLELKHSAIHHEARWRQIIARVREVYGGALTYSANWWVEWERVRFWDALDYIGIGAYFELERAPLFEDFRQPMRTVRQLGEAWQPILRDLRRAAARAGKPVLFTEVGYTGYCDCAERPWQWAGKQEKRVPIDHRRQAQAWDALLQACGAEPAIAGLFAWTFPTEARWVEPWEYSLTGRPAAAVLRAGYGR